jgi:processive 1,2-diacylglycerol beta-glucosyltransferase
MANVSGPGPSPDAALVSVLGTTEIGMLPVARAALDHAGIDYTVRNVGIASQIIGQRSIESVGETDTPIEILVRAEDAARAREVLRDLATPGVPVPPAPAPEGQAAEPATDGDAAVLLFDVQSGARIGAISDGQLQMLVDRLEEESADDQDYFIDVPTLTVLQDSGLDPRVVELLRRALGSREGMDIRWERR